MKNTLAAWIVGLSAMLAAGWAAADWDRGFDDTARVISATPVYETVRVYRPVEECWNERIVRRAPGSRVGTVAGAVVGGVVGNQVGHRRNRAATTVAGTLLGAAIGRSVSRYRDEPRYVTEERRCELVDNYETEERLAGYRVKYRYNGRTFVTRTRDHPGKRIPVRIGVHPVEDY
jgi:uncharacterized protein YcfJ